MTLLRSRGSTFPFMVFAAWVSPGNPRPSRDPWRGRHSPSGSHTGGPQFHRLEQFCIWTRTTQGSAAFLLQSAGRVCWSGVGVGGTGTMTPWEDAEVFIIRRSQEAERQVSRHTRHPEEGGGGRRPATPAPGQHEEPSDCRGLLRGAWIQVKCLLLS